MVYTAPGAEAAAALVAFLRRAAWVRPSGRTHAYALPSNAVFLSGCAGMWALRDRCPALAQPLECRLRAGAGFGAHARNPSPGP